MTVTSKEQAWEEVNKLFPTDYEKDYASSERAGYDIYRHPTLNYYNRICDLGDRLEVLIGEYGETVTNIWIKQPELLPLMGTNMSQSEYEKLCGNSNDWELTEKEAVVLINKEFGFEASRIEIIADVETFIKEGPYARPYQKFTRTPRHCATDWNYIRFNVNGWQYEMINGSLKHYWD